MQEKQRSFALKNTLVLAFIFVLALVGAVPQAAADKDRDDDHDDNDRSSYAIGLWGDFPYSDTQALTGVPNLIADMNSQKLEFVVHDGDLKGGNGIVGSMTPTTCSNELYQQALGFFNSIKTAAMFTPGDNDWTDCDREKNGGFNSLERLDYERKVFFSTPYSLGKHPIRQQVQSTPLCLGTSGPTACVENRRWTVGRVLYVTLNVQGSCNNLCDTDPDPSEYAARNAANIAWLKDSFSYAKEKRLAAIMLISQADPAFDTTTGLSDNTRDAKTLAQLTPVGAPDGFQEFLIELRNQVIAFQKPVAFVHGDSHYFRIDKPLLDAQGRRLENFTRIGTFGDHAGLDALHPEYDTNDVHWVKVLVDDHSREVFSFQAQIVPANRVAVPAP